MTAHKTRLVLRAANGDKEAFDELSASCRSWLSGICFRLVQDANTTEDLVQETLYQAYRDIKQLREPERFQAWLSRIAVNCCKMHLRRMLSKPNNCLLDEPDISEGPLPEHPFNIDDALLQVEENYRNLLLLFYDEGLNYRELAEALSLSTQAVKSRLHRAREQLRKEMLKTMTDKQKKKLGIKEAPAWELRTILLVETDTGIRNTLSKALQNAGYEVVELETGEEALQAIDKSRGQMLLLDKHCVEPYWLEVLLCIQVDTWCKENIPVAVFIDKDKKRDVFLAWQAGATICLTKPYRIDELLHYIQKIKETWMKGSEHACKSTSGNG